jgi:DNA (cytosine-5)-methyltransferase 1
MTKLRLLDLFSGIGGFSLGLERTGGFETVAFCEYAEFPRKVLAKHWPNVPIYPDVRELTAERLNADGLGRIDIICGGYPCQPFSYAGKREGAEDDRHLWPEMRRLVETLRPAWVIGENVAGHITMGLDDVLADLDGLGYATQAFVIPACAVGALHRRDRVWLVAHAGSQRPAAGTPCQGDGGTVCDSERDSASSETGWQEFEFGIAGNVEALADSGGIDGEGEFSTLDDSEGRQGPHIRQAGSYGDGLGWWKTEPAVGRVVDGIPKRMDRLAALGNAVVPQIPELIGRAILKSMEAA